MPSYRVVNWGTGPVGKESVACIVSHPDLELVGVRAYSKEKEGRDAGELCGLEPTGILATTDVDFLLGLRPDCVSFTASDLFGHDHVVGEMCQILRAGVNVVDVTITSLGYPPLLPELIKQLEAACQAGGSSFYYGGVNPGCAADFLPYIATSWSRDIESVEISEFLDATSYPTVELLQHAGMGLSPEEDAEKVKIEEIIGLWTPGPRLLIDALGCTLDDVQISREVVLAKHGYKVGTLDIAAGTIEAFHVELRFIIGGAARVVYHEYVRLAPALDEPWPASWPTTPGGSGGYLITVHGTPTIRLELSGNPSPNGKFWTTEDAFGALMQSSGNRIVNAIPEVCKAKPGVYTSLALHPNVSGAVAW